MVGVTKSAAAAIGFQSLVTDLGALWTPTVWTDSSASIGMCSRQGIGKVRHMDTQVMWIQQRVRNGDLGLRKVGGEWNPADILTKADIPRERMEKLLNSMSCSFEEGRASSAPLLKTEGGQNLFEVSLGGGGLNSERPGPSSSSGRAVGRTQELVERSKGGPQHRGRWADEEDEPETEAKGVTEALRQEGTQEGVEAGGAVPVPVAPPEAQEPDDELLLHGQELGAAGRGRAGLGLRARLEGTKGQRGS